MPLTRTLALNHIERRFGISRNDFEISYEPEPVAPMPQGRVRES
jgi:hypothetical protein